MRAVLTESDSVKSWTATKSILKAIHFKYTFVFAFTIAIAFSFEATLSGKKSDELREKKWVLADFLSWIRNQFFKNHFQTMALSKSFCFLNFVPFHAYIIHTIHQPQLHDWEWDVKMKMKIENVIDSPTTTTSYSMEGFQYLSFENRMHVFR